jgi:hypothetical protein
LGWKVPRSDVVAITAIGVFFGQVLPNIAGDAMRVWLLMRLGPDWRQGVISVLIDRAVGILTLLILSFAVLLFPSALTALGGHRDVIASVFGSIIAVSILGLCTPSLAAILERWQGTRMIGTLARATFQVLLRRRFGISIFGLAFAVHGLAIIAVSLLGRAQGLILPPLDAAVLFALMVAVSIIPISIGGWGLRELAVVSLLQSHGIQPERALFFSVCFGLALIVASLPGAVIWAFYSREPNAVRKSLRK